MYMLINLKMNESNYKSMSKFAYGTILLIIIAVTGWYVIPRVVDRVYEGGFDQAKIDAIRKSIAQKPNSRTPKELLVEVEVDNPNIDAVVMHEKVKEMLPDSKSKLSNTQKQTILNNLNKK